MKSIKARTAMMTIISILVTILMMGMIGIISLKDVGDSNAKQMLFLLCETGSKDLDYYFNSIEQSVEMISTFVQNDIEGLDEENFSKHVERTKDIFNKTAAKTSGVLTYYYRIDPEVSKEQKGFWFVKEGDDFKEHEVTDITLYDTSDTSSLVWFTVPKFEGKSVWLPPYNTDNLDVYVLSYNTPIYYQNKFIGVVGIELDYSTMADQVNNIKLFETGLAYINDDEGNLIYHPDYDTTKERPKVPVGVLSSDKYFEYTFNGIKKIGVWEKLSNGMRLNVVVPKSEVSATWKKLSYGLLAASILLMGFFAYLTVLMTNRITKPLNELANIANKVNDGNYEFDLNYNNDDEVGVLASAFKKLVNHLKQYIGDLNDLAYADALTGVRNKGAFDLYINDLQDEIRSNGKHIDLAIGMFDCDNLKTINDEYGHEKGDIYLKQAVDLICKTFKRSPVYRIGGDEFALVLKGDDYNNKEELMKKFEMACNETKKNKDEPWKQVSVSMGLAVFNPKEDMFVNDVVRRADKLMYDNKHEHKKH